MSPRTNKFTFDTEFRDGAEFASHAARARQKKTLTAEEIETMCADARADGTQAGQVRASENINQNLAALVIALRASLDQSHAAIEEVREDAAILALTVARKLAAAALNALPAADVEAALRQAMHQAIAEPRITLRATPDVAAEIRPRTEALAHEEAYEGRLMVVADPQFKGADCRIEWRGGGSERNEAAIEAAIAALIARRFPNFPISSDSNALKG